jgi:hypothetical protein
MAPHLADGARVEVRRARRYWPGDVAVFRNGAGWLTAHRALGRLPHRSEPRYWTAADRATEPDGALRHSDVVGKLCGGDCDPAVVRVPSTQRLRSAARFARFALRRLLVR